jgi:SAM-dependent methyltransferase
VVRHSWPVLHNHFEGRIAEGYDAATEISAPAFVDPVVDFLVDLADDGAALEFAIGTGRIALPLSRRGVRVHGIDLSPDMVAQLRKKPGWEEIGVTMGDFATTEVDGRFRLVYLVYNTVGNLTTQAEQVACFRNAARHLEVGGCFVVEVGVPSLRRLPPGETIRAFAVGPEHFGFDEYDVARQRGVSHHYWDRGGTLETFSCPYRFVWPSELDLMAQLAGMGLRERWSDWDRSPFTSESSKHVSVWEKATS